MSKMTQTERLTLKHIFKLNSHTIEVFDNLDLDDETRSFLIFKMMFPIYEKGEDKLEKELEKNKPGNKLFKFL